MTWMREFYPTGQQLSTLGLGTVKFGRNTGVKYPSGEGFDLPDDKTINDILDILIDHGVNVLDTAPAYGMSEERLGKLMGARRDQFFLMTKTGEEFDGENSKYIFTRDHTIKSIDRSLSRLNTDVLDCVLVHSNRDDVNVIDNTDVIETLSDLKKQGKIKSFGFSGYSADAGMKAVDVCDTVMVTYNMDDQSQLPVIEYAQAQKKGVFVKKGFSSGHINGTPDDHLRFVTNMDGVTSMIFGSMTPANILSNINVLRNT